MPNRQRDTVSPRIARMLRELEGPPSRESGSGADGDALASGAATPRHRAGTGHGRRMLVRAGVTAGTAMVAVLATMQARAPVGDDKHSAASAQPAAQHLTDARHATQSTGGGRDTKTR